LKEFILANDLAFTRIVKLGHNIIFDVEAFAKSQQRQITMSFSTAAEGIPAV
jgi:hypothetical protein